MLVSSIILGLVGISFAIVGFLVSMIGLAVLFLFKKGIKR